MWCTHDVTGWSCRQLEVVRDTLMDDARERVDFLGEQATQNESLGAALDRAYAARFSGAASSAPAQQEHSAAGAAQPDEPSLLAADGGSPAPDAPAAEIGPCKPAARSLNLAPEAQAAHASHQASDRAATEQATLADPGSNPSQPNAASDGQVAPGSAESAQAGDEQQGGAVAAAAVHAVPGEVAEAATSASKATAAAPAPPASATAASGTPAVDASAGIKLPKQAGEAEAEQGEPEQELPKSLDDLGRRILDWHWSHLEYGCSAPLDKACPSSLESALAPSLDDK